MALLKDTVISGSLRATDSIYTTTLQTAILNAPTASNGTSFGPGTNNNVLKSNGSSVFWGTIGKSEVGLGNVANSTYAGGTAVTLNGTSKAGSTASFYAPEGAGTANQYLKSSGSGAPTWETFSTSTVGLGNVSNNANLNSTTGAKGDIIYWSAANTPSHLTNTSSTTKNFLSITSQVPAWTTIGKSDVGLGNVTNDKQLPIAGGTMTGRLTAAKGFNNLLTGTGTAGVNNNGTYTPVKWTFNAGVTVTDGDRFTVKIPNITNGDYGIFMSVNNGTNYYPVGLLPNGRLTTHYAVGCYIDVVFEASGRVDSVFPLAGGTGRTNITSGGVWRVINFYDSNSDWGYYQRMIYPNLKAGTGSVHPYSIIMQLANGRWASVTTTAPNNPGASNVSPKETGKAANTNEFRLSPIYVMYANATYADGATIGTYNVWAYHSGLIDCRYSFNLQNNSTNGFIANSPVYLVGTMSNGLFKLDTTKWWSSALPTTEDGKIYIYIGDAYDWYRITLQEVKPIYQYKNGAVRLYTDYAGASDFTGKGTHTAAVTANEFVPPVGTLTVVGNVNNTTMTHTSNANAEMIIKAHPTSGTNYYEARLGFSSNGSLYYMPVNTTTWKTVAYTDSSITGNAANVTGTVAIANGGTGKTNASDAWTALGGGASGKHADSYFALAGHTHGNITNGGCITTAITKAKDDYLIIGDNSDSGKIGKGPIFCDTISSQTTSSKFLREDGTWSAPSYIANAAYGNINTSGQIGQTSGWALANGDGLVVFDSSASNKLERTGITFDASTETECLTKKGTWKAFNNYSHPTGDGNSHVPATSTTNGGKFLKAGTTANSAAWASITNPDIKPTISKTYAPANSYGTTDAEATCCFFFMSVKPDSWYKGWQIRFKLRTVADSYANVDSTTWCTINGRADSFIYHNWNERYDIGHYYIVGRSLKSAGFNAGLGHMIGVNVRYSTGRGTAAYTRKFYLDYYDCEGCTVTILDAANLWANLGNTTNYSDTNYNGYSNMDAVNRGLRESGDDNSTSISHLYEQYGGWHAGNLLGRYQFVFQSGIGSDSLVSIFPTDNNNVVGKTFTSIPFDPCGKIFYHNANGTTASGANIDPGRLYSRGLFDLRWSFNVASTTTTNAFTGVRYTPLYLQVQMVNNGTGLVQVVSPQPLVTSLPTAYPGGYYYYIYLGQVHDWYRVELSEDHPVYYWNIYGNTIQRYYGGTTKKNSEEQRPIFIVDGGGNTDTHARGVDGPLHWLHSGGRIYGYLLVPAYESTSDFYKFAFLRNDMVGLSDAEEIFDITVNGIDITASNNNILPGWYDVYWNFDTLKCDLTNTSFNATLPTVNLKVTFAVSGSGQNTRLARYTDPRINAAMSVLYYELSDDNVQLSDWTITTYDGYVDVNGASSQACNLTLTLGVTTT